MYEWVIEHASNPYALFFGLILLSFILEDLATLTGAALYAEGVASLPLAFSAVLLGIAIGDLGLYATGWSARSSSRLRAKLEKKHVFASATWMQHNLLWLVLLARFTPGLRLPTYAACGLLGLSFWRFAAYAVVMVSLWTIVLFWLASTLAEFANHYLALKESWWVIVPVLLVLLWLVQKLVRNRLAAKGEVVN